MKVLLLRDIENLGKEGEVKDVADGFAMNFLIPKNIAEPATDAAIQKAEAKKKKDAEKARIELEETQKLAEQLEGREVYLRVKEKDGKLFGSVNEKSIANALKDEGIDIDEKNIKITEPIKEIGEYEAQINLNHGLEANIRVILTGEE